MKFKKPIIFFDLETTGVDVCNDRIVQIATIKILPDGSRESKEYLINPTIPIPKEASDVHGITDDKVKDSPTFAKYAKNLLSYFEDSDIGGYNTNQFDIPLLVEEFKRCNLEFDLSNKSFIDVLKIERELNKMNLGEVYKRYTGKELENSHDALADVEATVVILENQIKKHKLSTSTFELDKFSQGENERVDLAGKLCNIDVEICWTFGKNFGKPIKNDMGFVNWFLKQTVPHETRKLIEKYTK